jgi:D-alanine-D-alanine ligase
LKIGIAYDLAPAVRPTDGPDDRYEEFDKPETVEAIADVIRGEGHEVILLGDGRELLEKVLRDPPDFVWNFAEGEGAGRCREARVPAVLEMLKIPYSGSDALTMAATLDKDVAKRLVRSAGVEVPAGVLISCYSVLKEVRAKIATLAEQVGFPLILKPAYEGSSKGIRGRALVSSEDEGVELWRSLAINYCGQPVLAEEFIDGDEVTVGLLDRYSPALGLVDGQTHVGILGAMRVVPIHPNGSFVYSLDVKRDWRNRVVYEAPAQLARETSNRLMTAALAAYRALGCRDLARIDFRIRAGVPYFLEANPLPGLAPETSDLVILARGCGLDYPDLIRRTLQTALTRVGLARAGTVVP